MSYPPPQGPFPPPAGFPDRSRGPAVRAAGRHPAPGTAPGRRRGRRPAVPAPARPGTGSMPPLGVHRSPTRTGQAPRAHQRQPPGRSASRGRRALPAHRRPRGRLHRRVATPSTSTSSTASSCSERRAAGSSTRCPTILLLVVLIIAALRLRDASTGQFDGLHPHRRPHRLGARHPVPAPVAARLVRRRRARSPVRIHPPAARGAGDLGRSHLVRVQRVPVEPAGPPESARLSAAVPAGLSAPAASEPGPTAPGLSALRLPAGLA